MEWSNLTDLMNIGVSWALFGLIWTIQLSHYPAFQFIEDEKFLAFHQHHTSSITLVVMPLMLLELALSIWLVYQQGWNWSIPLFLVIAIWASTFLIQIPLHHQLGSGKDLTIIQKLVYTNWIRTILWTTKALLVSWYFLKIDN